MVRRLSDAPDATVTIAVDGVAVPARAGETVATAMLAAGFWAFRTTGSSGSVRGPYCMMGVCFDCLVTIDGVGSRQACLVQVHEGMRIETQRGRRPVGP
jgi:predicted molibdopterin-dependent oxidoreductase YjgC